jgi:hypothetical protein
LLLYTICSALPEDILASEGEFRVQSSRTPAVSRAQEPERRRSAGSWASAPVLGSATMCPRLECGSVPSASPPALMLASAVCRTSQRWACGFGSLRSHRDFTHLWCRFEAVRAHSIDDRLVDELTEQLAELALPRPGLRLGHEDGDQLFFRIYPERGTPRSAPGVLARGTGGTV